MSSGQSRRALTKSWEGVEAQLEGLFRDTYNYTVGTRSVSSLMLELVYIAERSNVKIPAAVFE